MTKSLFSYAKCLAQRCGPGLSAQRTTSSPSRVPTYALSFFLVRRANRSRREALGL